MVEVMLMADVKKLGKAGAIVKVAPGYARNMLLPQGLAAPVTEAARRRLAKLEEARAKARAEAKKAAQAVAELLGAMTVLVAMAAMPLLGTKRRATTEETAETQAFVIRTTRLVLASVATAAAVAAVRRCALLTGVNKIPTSTLWQV